MSALLTRNVLVRDPEHVSTQSAGDSQIHAVTGRSDQTDISECIHRSQLLEGDGAVHEDDGLPSRGAELAIDAPYQLVDARSEVHVFFHILSGGNRQLNENHLGLSASCATICVPCRSTPGVGLGRPPGHAAFEECL